MSGSNGCIFHESSDQGIHLRSLLHLPRITDIPLPLHRGEAQNEHKVTTAIDGPPPSLGGSPNNPMMVTHQKEVYYRLGIWHLHITYKTNTRWQLPWMITYHSLDGHPPTLGWLPTKWKCTRGFDLAIALYSQNWHQVTTAGWSYYDGHPPNQGYGMVNQEGQPPSGWDKISNFLGT